MARLVSDFRYLSQTDPNPDAIMTRMNRILYKRSKKGMFATAIYILLNTKTKTLSYANAGHHPLIVRNPKGQMVPQTQGGGIPLGINQEPVYDQYNISLSPKELVFLYTDGAIEPVNEKNEPFGSKRLLDLVSRFNGHPKDLLDQIKTTIDTFTQSTEPFDDVSFLALNVL